MPSSADEGGSLHVSGVRDLDWWIAVHSFSDQAPTPPAASSACALPTTIDETQPRSPQEDHLAQRMMNILAYARTAGFENRDSFAISYYTEHFESSHALSHAQKWSRQHRLSDLIHALRRSSRLWDEGESRGLKEENLRAAETIYKKEVMHSQKSNIL